ncbi:hypothetical protein M0802_010344 [Mischocyttarus mexicanus]|nr:hypothetical protein M0802_010344 [Mischocyttarus mexicanus]
MNSRLLLFGGKEDRKGKKGVVEDVRGRNKGLEVVLRKNVKYRYDNVLENAFTLWKWEPTLVGWLVGWLVGQVVRWLVGSLVGSLVGLVG